MPIRIKEDDVGELTSEGFAACYRGLEVLTGAMHEWAGKSTRSCADIWLPDGPIARIQRFGTCVEVLIFESIENFRAWQQVLGGASADERFRYVRLSPSIENEESPQVCLQHFEEFGRSAPVDDAMARRVEYVCRRLASTLRHALRQAA